MELREIFSVDHPIIGPVVLKPLPGSPLFKGSLEDVVKEALDEARTLEEGGVDGISFENLGDAPYFKTTAPPETVASFGRVIGEVKRKTSLPIGVNVLRNCAEASLALSYAYGGRWIRVNILTEAYVADQGLIEGVAAELMRKRLTLGAQSVAVFADVHVKHASPLGVRSIRDSALDMVERGLADALIVTGPRTGSPPSAEDLKAVKGLKSVLIGSGLSHENVKGLLPLADGAIVSSCFRKNGSVMNELEPERIKRFMSQVRSLRRK
ncbi:MAG: BtpA/SgcQ family protein [Nitrososphaerota archaeon]|nr:BtpA/SgcQ family protein [Nitrososphaerota archaeon]